MTRVVLGIDVGTSGVRAVAIDAQRRIMARASTAMPDPLRHGVEVEQDAHIWWQALCATTRALRPQLQHHDIVGLALDATSGTVLALDAHHLPVAPALMYSDGRANANAQRIAAVAPSESAAHGAFSSLAKYLWLQHHVKDEISLIRNQADWLIGRLTDDFTLSDMNNCLKLGYDAVCHEWPDWLETLGIDRRHLPRVVAPGTLLGHITPTAAADLDLPVSIKVVAGTTDSTAAFLATGANAPGSAVTSLGSTLVLKVLSEEPVFAPAHGVYSQPLGHLWLVGGGSNTGGNVLRHFFSNDDIQALTPKLHPEQVTTLDYYPLLAPGERFPVCDPNWQPRLVPRPPQPEVFLQGLLEGMAQIEAEGYRLLAALGAPYPSMVYSVGGGAQNTAWTTIRARALGVPLLKPEHDEAAFGAALLALPLITVE